MKAPLHLLPLAAALLLAFDAQAAEPVRVQFVAGDARAIGADGSSRSLAKGDVLAPGERVVTGGNGLVQIRAEGQGVAALRANSDVKLPPGAEGLSLNVLSGQVRTVALPGNGSAPPVRLTTPTGSVEMKKGDFVSAVPEGGPGAPGESFVKVNAGEAQVRGRDETSLAVAPGKAVAVGGETLRAMAPADIPEAVLPPLSVAPLPVGSKVAAPTVISEKVLAGIDARLPAVADVRLPVPSAIPLPGAAPRPGATALSGATDAGASGVPRDIGKLPDIRPVVTTLRVDGGSAIINNALGRVPVVEVGRGGTGDQAVNLVDPAAIASRPPVTTTVLQPTLSVVGNQNLPTLSPKSGTSLSNSGVVASGIVLSAPILSMGATPTRVINLGNTTLNQVLVPNVVDPRTGGAINSGTLNFNTIRKF